MSAGHETEGMRVLVAANKASAANSTAKFLRGKKYEVVTCTSGSKLLELLKTQVFDVVLAESDGKANNPRADPVDGLSLLSLEFVPPVVVAMDQSNKDAVRSAVQQGAVDVIALPMNKQQERLSSLWQHGLRRQGSAASATTSKESASTDLMMPDLLLMAASVKDDLLNLDDLELEPLDCDYRCTGETVPGAELDDPLLDVTSAFLECASPRASSVEDNLHRLDTFSTDEVVSSMLSVSSSEESGDKKRCWNDMGDSQAATSQACEDSEKMDTMDNSDVCSIDSDCCDDKSKSKKQKVEWTRDLHDRFVEAVETLGADKAVPSRILERMGADGTGLTRQNIASHLQKYRHRTRVVGPVTVSSKPQDSVATPIVQAILPSVPHSGGFPVASQGTLLLAPGAAMPATARGQPAQARHLAQQWVQPMQMWGPWPQGTVLYNHLGHPIVPQALPAATFCHVLGSQTGPSADQVQKAIKEVLSRPKGKAPLGLALDMSKMLEKVKGMSSELLAKPSAPAAA